MAAAAAIVVVISFQMAREHDNGDFYFDVAGGIAMRHNDYAKFDVKAASFEGVQKGLKDLGFSVTPLVKQKLLSAYEVIGARYCQLEGQQATGGPHAGAKSANGSFVYALCCITERFIGNAQKLGWAYRSRS